MERNPWRPGFAMDDIIRLWGADGVMKAYVSRSFGLLCLAVLLAYPPMFRLLSLAV
jgi:hypothetical protein